MPEINSVLAERGARYGTFTDNAILTQDLLNTLLARTPYRDPLFVEALHMICHKLARAVCGDPLYKDNFVDIAGYAKLYADAAEPRILEFSRKVKEAKILDSDPRAIVVRLEGIPNAQIISFSRKVISVDYFTTSNSLVVEFDK